MSRHRKRRKNELEMGEFSRRESLRRDGTGVRRYLSVEDAAMVASVSVGQVLKWVRNEEIPSLNRNGKIFLQREELLEAVGIQ